MAIFGDPSARTLIRVRRIPARDPLHCATLANAGAQCVRTQSLTLPEPQRGFGVLVAIAGSGGSGGMTAGTMLLGRQMARAGLVRPDEAHQRTADPAA